MNSIRIPRSAFTNLLHDYAEAFFNRQVMKNTDWQGKYWQAKEEALMSAINYCFGYNSLEITERDDFKQILRELESHFHQQHNE